MSLWRICFSLAFLVAPAAAATVCGHIVLSDSHAPAVRKNSNYSGVVVWLESPNAPKAVAHARMIQKDKTFSPHILPLQVGATVEFPNYDPIFHNAFSNFSGQLFDVGLYPPGTSRSVRFQREGVVRIFCNIHASMSAVIVVVNSPYFAVSKDSGAFEIPNVLPGPALLRVFHERAEADTLHALERRVVVTDAPLILPDIAISESGYLAVPHKDKYGKDYRTPPDQSGMYPGGMK